MLTIRPLAKTFTRIKPTADCTSFEPLYSSKAHDLKLFPYTINQAHIEEPQNCVSAFPIHPKSALGKKGKEAKRGREKVKLDKRENKSKH
jgi:hypothetical protein